MLTPRSLYQRLVKYYEGQVNNPELVIVSGTEVVANAY